MIELLKIEHECMLRCAHDDCDRKCADCELVQEDGELHEMYTNVVCLLKEQEAKTQGADSGMCEICSFYERAMPVKPVLDEQTGRIWLCGKCGSYVGFEDNDPHDPNEFDKYCRECGRPVLWEGR